MNQVAESIRDDLPGQPQILLMEDESSVAQGLQMVLREEGYKVDLAMTGQSALNTISHKGFDLLVADLRLPDMDGMEVIKRVKDERPETKVIVITGYANVDSAVDAMKTGVVEYLPKPFTDDQFKEAVGEALKEKRMGPIKRDLKLMETAGKRLITAKDILTSLASVNLERIKEHTKRPSNVQDILIESSLDGIMACDGDGKIIIFNKSLVKMLGYPKDEVCDKMSFNDFFQPIGEAEKFRKRLYSEEHGGKNRLSLFETNFRMKMGGKIPVQISASVMFEEGQEIGIAAFCKDLRELRRQEQECVDQERLLQHHKMISLGRLAASVVHEINNPLGGILNYIRLMIKILKRDTLDREHMGKFQRYLDLAEGEISRCSKIVSSLLAFSRKSKLEFSEVNVHEVVEKSILLSQHKLDLQHIRVRTELEEVPTIWGDFNQLQQCMINLIFNAIDAMPDGGALNVGCSFKKDQGRVEIRVGDTGCGIAKEDLSHIFEPFYTTKTEGSGLGLGLATVCGIIERHKGEIRVDSEPGKGAIFHITIPVGQ